MKLISLLGRSVSFLLLLSPAQAAQQPESLPALFQEANNQYQKGDFASAERIYRRLIEAAADSASLYYNLGNACFKQKKLGEAIFFWEKARQKVPGDPEVQENLELANLLVVDRIEVPPDPFFLRILRNTTHFLTIEQDSRIVLILFVVTNGLLGSYFLARSSRLAFVGLLASIAAAALLLLFTCSLGWKIYEDKYRQEGVIVEQKVEIRSGPGAENITVFTVHEGVKVRVRGETAGWYQVSLPNGWSGWLEKNSVRIL